jgi:hypothetical protein
MRARIEKIAKIEALTRDPGATDGERQAALFMVARMTKTARTAASKYDIGASPLPSTLNLYA